MAERPRFRERIRSGLAIPLTALTLGVMGPALISAYGPDVLDSIAPPAAAAGEGKKPDCKISKPRFRQVSQRTIHEDDNGVTKEVRLKDCLGTVVLCFKVNGDYSEDSSGLNCNWEDYNKRAKKNFAEANAPR